MEENHETGITVNRNIFRKVKEIYKKLKGREREDIGVEKFMQTLENQFTEKQRERTSQIMGELAEVIRNSRISDQSEAIIKYAAGLEDPKLSFWALGFYSQGHVETTSGENKKQRDLVAGEILDNLARKLIKYIALSANG